MIVGPDFVWLHFPKCAGTATEKLLHTLLADRPGVRFDEITHRRMIWHDSISHRSHRDLGFDIGKKRIIANFRRLPPWLLSRVHFEARRPPHQITPRELLVRGQFLERTGGINAADSYVRHYNMPRVDCWIRSEHLAEDLAAAFALDPAVVNAEVAARGRTDAGYVKDLAFWFTPVELAGLYEANPLWAELERRLYGGLLG